jgi:hypothetical protein
MMVDCEICDKSHLPDHPHIANIDGDIPIDDDPLVQASMDRRPIGRAELPDWLKDKPGAQMIRPATPAVDPQELCQVCGEPWAPKHDCKLAKAGEPAFNGPMSPPNSPDKQREYVTSRKADRCDDCGLIKRSNHRCKGAAVNRHDELIIKGPQKLVEINQPVQEESPRAPDEPSSPLDQELAAIGTMVKALEGMKSSQVRRILAYIADRTGAEGDGCTASLPRPSTSFAG